MKRRRLPARPSRRAVGAALRLAAIAAPLAPLPLAAHDAPTGWTYPADCCSNQDCAPIAPEAVVETGRGYRVTVRVGAETLTREFVHPGLAVSQDERHYRVSPDTSWHACVVPGYGLGPGFVRCLFAPGGAA